MKYLNIKVIIPLLVLVVLTTISVLFMFLEKAWNNENTRFNMKGNLIISKAFFSTATASQNIPLVVSGFTDNVKNPASLDEDEKIYLTELLRNELNDFSSIDSVVRGSMFDSGMEADFGFRFYVSEFKIKSSDEFIKVVGGNSGQKRIKLFTEGTINNDSITNSFYLYNSRSHIQIEMVSGFTGKNIYFLKRIRNEVFISLTILIIVFTVLAFIIKYLIYQKRAIEMKSDFINNITHEFNTPLSTIMVSANALSKDVVIENAEMVRFNANLIKKQNYRLQKLVDNAMILSDFNSDGVVIDKKPVNLEVFLNDSVSKYKNESKQVEFSINVDNNIDIVSLDEFNMVTVLNNLIDNSLKYCNKDYIVIGIQASAVGELLHLKYSDNGEMGVNKLSGKIFNKFYRGEQGKGNTKGIGIGLYLVKRIVKAHGGDISICTDSKNTTFNIKIPLQ